MKKVDEGVELFDEIWEKVYAAEQQNQKEKYEMDLKKEIKKLQRLRDQIKTWIGSSDVKDKDDLIEARKLIETKMEQFKVCEKETKTKTYSKEGLARAERLDPGEQAKQETETWIRDYIDQLTSLCEDAEVEIERLSAGKGKKTFKVQIEECMHFTSQHKFHIHKLEGIIRLVINDVLDVDVVDPLKDDLDYYVESHGDDDYQQAYDEEFFYEALGLDELDIVDVDRVTQVETKKELPSTDDSSASTSKGGRKEKKSAPASIPFKIGRAAPKNKNEPEEKVVIVTPKKVMGPAPVRAPPPPPPAGGASMAAILKREQDQEKERQQKALAQQQRQAAELQRQQQLLLQKQQQQQQELLRQEELQRKQALQKAQEEQQILLQQQQIAEQQRRQEAAQKQQLLQQAQKAAEQLSAQQPQPPPTDGMDILNYGLAGLSLGNSLDSNGDSSTNNKSVSGSSFDSGYLSAINESFAHMPTNADSDRQKPYTPRNPYPTPTSYPSAPSPIFDNPAVFEKLGTDALFFMFYYAQGTYQQYLAARELKKQSWRYHKKYMTWFQRHEEPKVTTDEYEQGAYIYFDYETGWCQRIKSDFRFEYSFLEDSLQ